MAGDVWTWVALDADTKIVPSYRVGPRDHRTAVAFLDELQKRLAHRVQLTSDGWKPYLTAVGETFGNDVDYAQLSSSTAAMTVALPSAATPPPSAWTRSRSPSSATPTRTTSALVTSSG